MALSLKRFDEIAHIIALTKLPVLIRGRHGIGKSQCIYQFAKKMGLPVVERRAAQMTEGDIIGLPDKSGKVTKFLPPDWLYQACTEPVVLFFDEVDRAQPEVRMGIFELLDSRKIYNNKLHPDTLVFAAINGGTRGAVGSQYLVQSFCPAEMDRWLVYDIEPKIEEFLDWAKDSFHPFVWNFLNEQKAHIEHTDIFAPTKKYPSRRSWDRLNQTLMASPFLKDTKASASDILDLAEGFVGLEAAIALQKFGQTFQKSVQVQDIVVHGKFDLLKGFSASEFSEFIEKMDFEGVFKNKSLTIPERQNICYLFGMLPSEHGMTIWKKFASSDNSLLMKEMWPLECDKDTHENVMVRTQKYNGQAKNNEAQADTAQA